MLKIILEIISNILSEIVSDWLKSLWKKKDFNNVNN